MKETIRIKLTKDAEKALIILYKLTKKSKKEIIDMLIEEKCSDTMKSFEIGSIGKKEESNFDTRRVNSLKKKFYSDVLEIKSYAIDHESKKKLKKASKELKINMGLTLSILLENKIRGLTSEVDRSQKVDELLSKLKNLKQKISNDVYEMNTIWYELLEQYPDEEINSPFYSELVYFFDGFHQFDP